MSRRGPTLLLKVPRRWSMVTLLLAAFLLGPGAAGAQADPFLPTAGKIFAAVAEPTRRSWVPDPGGADTAGADPGAADTAGQC